MSKSKRPGIRVLVADDEAEVRDAYRQILQAADMGGETAVFRNLRERLFAKGAPEQVARQLAARKTVFAPVFCDGAESAVAAVRESIAAVKLAYFDALTGLPNREQSRSRLSSALAAAQQSERMMAVLYLDLDNFKRVNDTLGHAVGDELLTVVATRLRHSLRMKRLLQIGELLSGGTMPPISPGSTSEYAVHMTISMAGSSSRMRCRPYAVGPRRHAHVQDRDGEGIVSSRCRVRFEST